MLPSDSDWPIPKGVTSTSMNSGTRSGVHSTSRLRMSTSRRPPSSMPAAFPLMRIGTSTRNFWPWATS